MKVSEWKLEDYINTPQDLMDFFEASVELIKDKSAADRKNFDWVIHVCRDILRIAKLKGWDK